MKFWDLLLKALHSALIDELAERYPEPKPELGLPVRSKGFDAPLGCVESMIVRAGDDERPGTGWVMLSANQEFRNAVSLESLWEALGRRAEAEFGRRCIKPVFSRPEVSPARIADPSGAASPGRVIWVPFRVAAGEIFLGVGI